MTSVVTCSAAISACATVAWQEALHLFELIEQPKHADPSQLHTHTSQSGANSVTFNAVILASEKGRRWESALMFMHFMEIRRFQCDLLTCNAVVSACSCCFRQGGKVCMCFEMLSLLGECMVRDHKHSVPSFVHFSLRFRFVGFSCPAGRMRSTC